MALDIAALQHLYGANMTYRTGNDTYRLPQADKSERSGRASGMPAASTRSATRARTGRRPSIFRPRP